METDAERCLCAVAEGKVQRACALLVTHILGCYLVEYHAVSVGLFGQLDAAAGDACRCGVAPVSDGYSLTVVILISVIKLIISGVGISHKYSESL